MGKIFPLKGTIHAAERGRALLTTERRVNVSDYDYDAGAKDWSLATCPGFCCLLQLKLIQQNSGHMKQREGGWGISSDCCL